ncbi:hypothetical protein [Bradyrhizobium sp.]|uniref:hypothetical protein n=1 Tax=Bradyrhizobium sp. TaxID=376 RepID=UPI002639713B|nr:hypothetical protein [Bradyrhizobium sp.]
MARRSILLLLLVVFAPPGMASAQNAFPAPLPGANPPTSIPNPPAGGDSGGFGGMPSPSPSQGNCANDYGTLHDEAVRRGALIRAASARHASARQACKLLDEFMAAEMKMLDFVQAESAKCGIPSNIADQLNRVHKKTETMRERVCSSADPPQKRWPDGTQINDFGDPMFKQR